MITTITILVAVASLVGTVANVYKRRWCFWVWLVTNLFWAVYDTAMGAYAQGGLMLIYAALAALGLYKWRKP